MSSVSLKSVAYFTMSPRAPLANFTMLPSESCPYMGLYRGSGVDLLEPRVNQLWPMKTQSQGPGVLSS